MAFSAALLFLAGGSPTLESSTPLPDGSSITFAESREPEGAFLMVRDQIGNWARIGLTQNQGMWVAEAAGEEGGKPLVGRDPRFEPKRHRQELDGRYSLPFRKPDGRLRLFRDTVGGMLRFAWGFTDKVAGKTVKGWIELAPFADVLQGEVRATSSWGQPKASPIPSHDKDDRRTGFKVTKRPFHWSGAFGDSYVVTFDDAFAWREEDIKLSFWSEASFTPNWVMSKRAMQGFEFLETWGGGAKGCYEPMSDRVNRFSRVEVIEDTPARKIMRWSYVLVNPDYVPWGQASGAKQLPEAEEEWTIYPDGSVVRRQRFWPVLDTQEEQHSLGVQLAEADIVFASNTEPQDVVSPQALSGFGPGGVSAPATYPRQASGTPRPRVGDWPRFGLAVHYLDPRLPDPFIGFAPGRGGLLDVSLDWPDTWHEERFWRFSHFPFNHEPFQYETNSQTDGKGLITHACLAYVGDSRWASTLQGFKTDERGRKFWEWSSLLGMEKKRSLEAMDRRIADWQDGARWKGTIRGGRGTWNQARGELSVDPHSERVTVGKGTGRRPALILKGWKSVRGVTLEGRQLRRGTEWRTGPTSQGVLVWVSPSVGPGALVLTKGA
jgi:hypothetical protein